jgi:hypothetical protein
LRKCPYFRKTGFPAKNKDEMNFHLFLLNGRLEAFLHHNFALYGATWYPNSPDITWQTHA